MSDQIVTRNTGVRGEQGTGFILGEAGYIIIDGPSGAGGHAANAPGPDGVAFNPDSQDMIIYDAKDYLAKDKTSGLLRLRTIDKSTALVDNLSTDFFDQLITKLGQRSDLPWRGVIEARLRACRESLATGRIWPSFTRVAVIRWGGGLVGIGSELRRRNVQFIDLETDPVIQAGRIKNSRYLRELVESVERIRKQMNLYQGEHELQRQQLEYRNFGSPLAVAQSTVTALGRATHFVGGVQFPPLSIWANAIDASEAALSAARLGRVELASGMAAKAHLRALLALKKYQTWQDKLVGTPYAMGAAQKMEYFIGAVALVTVLSAGAVYAFSAAAAAGGATTAASTAAAESVTLAAANRAAAREVLVRLATTVSEGERKIRIAASLIEAEEAVLEEEAIIRTLIR